MATFKMALFLGCSLLLMGSGVAHSSPVRVTLTAPETEVKAGSEVSVEVTLTNISNRIVTLELTSPFCDYDVEVRESAGNLAPDTEVKKATDCAHREMTGRHIIVQLRPHESEKESIPVSAFSDMSMPGKYTVTVTWKAPKELGNLAVKSNAVTVTVTE